MNKHQTGTLYEQKACEYLQKAGYRILARNYRCKYGEIDIVASQGGYLCFVEVKYRKNAASGHPLEAVGYQKQKRIITASLYYRMMHQINEQTPIRYDVVAICNEEVTLVKNAFV
jgi:putative endonuclease